MFDIIRVLRAASRPVTAAAIAEELEVTVRIIYRDVATLQARRIPIEGAAGVGYVLRRGYELPPLMFTEDEAEAIAVGVRLLARTGDPGLQKAAESVLSKVTLVVPDPLRDYLTNAPVYVSKSGAPVPAQRDLPSTIRHAIRAARKMRIAYQDGRRAKHGAGNPALCRRLLRWSDFDLRLVRAAQRCPSFPHRPGGQRRCARPVVLNP
jgi:predicted DNA-binding transcriptional regulator YafY